MVGRPTEQQVVGLAPDASSLAAGRKLATPAPWSGTGCDDRAVWGACRGSAKLPYQVACDTHGPAYRCSCPSRKFPCKHAVALLLLWAQRSSLVLDATPPPDVAAWLATRSAKGAAVAVAGPSPDEGGAGIPPVVAAGPSPDPDGVGSRPPTADGAALDPGGNGATGNGRPPDPAAAQARVEQRTARIVAGMGELDRWLGDLVGRGLAHAQSQPYRFWDAMAARLVDAQAPAAAGRVRDLAGVVRSGDGWPDRLLARLCRLHLLAQGWARYDSMDEGTRADLRSAAGWPWPSEHVLAGPREDDRWYVLARSITEEDQVLAQRSWLWGLDTGRLAVIVDFARPGVAFTWDLWPGNVLFAALARYPGSAPLRVLVADRRGEPEPGGPPPGWQDLPTLADARDRAFAANPWLDSWPVSVAQVAPEVRFGRWSITDRHGTAAALSVPEPAGWRLLALSAGRPLHLLGEWFDGAISPLGVWVEDRMVVL